MTHATNRLIGLALAAAAGVGTLFVDENANPRVTGSLVSQAHAVIGRPLTPMSYAGVARRTTRRAVAVGAAAGAYAAPVVVAPACVQAVDAYGRVYTRCP
ncbi:MAG TPA: hypothetical protein VE909_04780 [Xanthobacteraceae bacterium]|nr:hypothetical protein [Xanthobacteraceae bacterium]